MAFLRRGKPIVQLLCHEYYPNLPTEDRREEKIARKVAGYVKISEWRKKQYMKARIKAEVKRVLIKRGFKNYSTINELSELIVEHATAMV